ncbi:MAG: biotin synthase, partial [Sphingopyxis sp.]|nr:biotin synthase [Sphingopyxis sp.]
RRFKSAPRFAAAGQSTQMIVGADNASDSDIVGTADRLYNTHSLRRVYYSAFSPIPDASAVLPLRSPPLMREHRLYQSDWMMRFYGFAPGEIAAATDADGMLPLDIDPKLAWALQNRAMFPVDVNRADRGALLRVPGLGVKSVNAIIRARRFRTLRLDDIGRITRSINKVRPFLITADWRPVMLSDRADIDTFVRPPAQQFELFAA